MHGIIFEELEEYTTTRHGSEAWETVLEAADLGSRTYLPINAYPDEELLAIVSAATEITGTPREELLTDFGQFAVQDLLHRYRAFLEEEWTALDVLENTEETMHKAVRLQEDDAEPPELDCRRVSDDEVVIEYSSDHQLCDLGEGIVKGIASEYDTRLAVDQERCMLDGDSRCEIHVSRL